MRTVKFFLAAILLIVSTQSSALFMPAGDNLNTDEDIVFNDVGC